jgi:Ca2+/Na+ antiporter
MNIEDMQKIWNAQDQKVYYAIDEETLFDQIKRRTARLRHAVNRDEIGLMLISAIAIVILLLTKVPSVFNILTILMLVAIAIFIYLARRRRLERETSYGLTVQDNINHAMDLAKYRIRSAKTFVWWYMLPLAIPTFGNMLTGNRKEWWQWVLIIGAFVVSYAIIRWELMKRYTPGLRKLENIKSQITAV